MAGNPKGNLKNLKSFGTGAFSPEKEREIHSKGGVAGAKSKRKRKKLKETIEDVLSLPLKDAKLNKKLKSMGMDDSDNQVGVVMALFLSALKGNPKAFELIRDTIGEKPIDQKEIKEITTEWFK